MKNFATSIAIHASAQTVWSLLTDAAGYPAWNSTIEKIEGQIARDEKITVHAKVVRRAFPLTVTSFEPERGMAWSGGLPLGLFTGTRIFTLTQADDGSVTFAMHETFSGVLAGLIVRFIPDLQPTFDTFAADLKRRAEQPA